MAKISVIMPMYNVEKFVSRAIESIISQTYQNWELIIIDDGSPDKSAEIANSYAEKDNRIKVVHKTNGGLSDARNFGLKFISGEYVHFFDSDDWIEEDFYEEMLKFKDEKPDIVIGGYSIHSTSSKNIVAQSVKQIQYPKNNAFEFVAFISDFFNFAWNKLFKSSFLISNHLKYEKGLKYIEDCEFMSRVIKYNPKIIYSKSIGYVYRIDHRNTLSRQFNMDLTKITERRIDCMNKILHFLTDDPLLVKESIQYARFYYLKALFHSLFGFNRNENLKVKYSHLKKIFNSKLTIHTECVPGLSLIDKIRWHLYFGQHRLITLFLHSFFNS